MIKIIYSFLIILSFINFVKGQGAGNWYFNQSVNHATNSEVYNYKTNKEFDYSKYYNPNIVGDTAILIESNVLMNVKADSYLAMLGIAQVGETVELSHDLINNRIKNFIDDLSKLGISSENIYTDFISQVPIFEYEIEKKLFSKTYNEIPKGFEVRKNIYIKYNDFKLAEKIITLAAKNEIYDIIKVDYIVNNVQAVYDSLRSLSANIINKKVKEYKKTGIKFDSKFQTISEKIYSTYPIERYSSYLCFNSSSINALNKNGNKLVNNDNNKSLYYNKLPYNDYDMIINPVIIEPVVQFSFNLQMKFVLKKQ